MGVLNASVPANSRTVSPFPPQFSIKTLNKKNPYRFCVSISKFCKVPSSPCYLALSGARSLQISAHFGRPSARRNTLRKKLLDEQMVRRNLNLEPAPDFQAPNRGIDHGESLQGNLHYGSVKEIDFGPRFLDDDNDLVEQISVKESNVKRLGDSVLLNELENWVHQYKKDAEYWGIGSGPIFTVFQDLGGNVETVKVDEDEILRRSQVGIGELKDLGDVNSKILHAKKMAKDMENGNSMIPRNSYLAKFVVSNVESGFVNTIRGVILDPEFIPRFSVVGRAVICSLVVFWVVKKLFFGNKEVQYSELEKEMMRRKIKSRKEKEMLEKGSVEVIQEASEPALLSFEKPKLDKQELMNSILKAKASRDKVTLLDSSSTSAAKPTCLDNKIQEIRELAKQARELEGSNQCLVAEDQKEEQALHAELSQETEVVEEQTENNVSFVQNLLNGDSGHGRSIDETEVLVASADQKSENSGYPSCIVSEENRDMRTSISSGVEVLKGKQNLSEGLNDDESMSLLTSTKEADLSFGTPNGESNSSVGMKPRVIRSVKEAREFLSRKCGKNDFNQDVKTILGNINSSTPQIDKESGRNRSQVVEDKVKVFSPAIFTGESGSIPAPNTCSEVSFVKDNQSITTKKDDPEDSGEGYEVVIRQGGPTPVDDESSESSTKEPPVETKNWIQKNFHEVEPILGKIGSGFRDNYKVAREKVSQESNGNIKMTQLGSNEDENELEWMKDDKLREIVFQVRENELAGRDPFYLMDAGDKLAFFQGLEKIVETENEKLSHVHDWLHSNIENLDYGADGISLYDPPEKIIPRWKGPPLEKDLEFQNDYLELRKALFPEAATSFPVKKDELDFLQKSEETEADEKIATCLADNNIEKKPHCKHSKNSKIVIESSDGSTRSGKKSGKEYWQHTKKWSRGFLDSYNAETDPEVKSIMKDIGKDLDRWITEEEIQESADLMTKLPEKNKKFMEKKLNKLKREMELFGPQAVVSKYREYADDKEEDYLWWLDLPHVLGIELYTIENGEQRIGFYALEMATDLELEPKPRHLIAFEDAAECKNLCYIIQAHLDMLGNGNAFVVPRPPKDAFREAKANGFGVTVIRKGELQLSVDQTLEEVEEQLCEIGSKIYHDKIMQERSVDISSLMKGVFGVSWKTKATRRKRSKGKLNRLSKNRS